MRPLGRQSNIHRRSAHAADPVYSLRQNPLRQLNFETPFPRFYRAQARAGRTALARRSAGGARAARAHGGARAARAQLGGDGPVGPFGVIPKRFRMESNFEWRVITKGSPLRNEDRG